MRVIDKIDHEWRLKEWRELSRHFHPVTVRQVVEYDISVGEYEELRKAAPKFKNFKSVFQLLGYGVRTYRRRRKLWRFIKNIKDKIKRPSDLTRPDQNGSFDPLKIPFVTWLDELFYLFGKNYGYSSEQVLDLPFASINDMRLAIEYFNSQKLAEIVIACNPADEKAVEQLLESPIRSGGLSRELEFEVYDENRKQYMRH